MSGFIAVVLADRGLGVSDSQAKGPGVPFGLGVPDSGSHSCCSPAVLSKVKAIE